MTALFVLVQERRAFYIDSGWGADIAVCLFLKIGNAFPQTFLK